MKIRPLYDRLVVRRLRDEAERASGIIIPDSAKEKPLRGEVVAAGKGFLTAKGIVRPLGIRVGDRILFGKYVGSEITFEGKEFVILREEDVLGILESQAAEQRGIAEVLAGADPNLPEDPSGSQACALPGDDPTDPRGELGQA